MSSSVIFSDRYVDANTPIHAMDGRVKLPAALLYIFAISLTRQAEWSVLAALAVPIVIVAVLARFSPGFMLGRSILALPFVLAALPLVFTRPGPTVGSVPFLGWPLSHDGIEAVLTICARSWLSVLVAVLLTGTTPAIELLRALRTLRVPRLIIATVFFAYRYFFVIGEEATRLLRARDSRSAALEGQHAGGTIRWRAAVAGHMVGSLFTRSIERSDRVYSAMQARGFNGDLRFLTEPAVRVSDGAWAVLVVVYAFAAQAVVRLT
ncbi:MAG: cobalt ECF transporter T component CbiQ [Chloroflexota bacterium]